MQLQCVVQHVKRIRTNLILFFYIITGLLGCDQPDQQKQTTQQDGFDSLGTQRFIDTNYIDLRDIDKISLFRSGVGHDYSDEFEECQNMKHYFWPIGGDPGGQQGNWEMLSIFSPIDGKIIRLQEEWAGDQIEIQSDENPNYSVILFHVTPTIPIDISDTLYAGQQIGHHIGSQTMSDIAVRVQIDDSWKLLSYFDVMTDGLFEEFIGHGANTREDFIISAEERRENPLSCEQGNFTTQSTLEDWFLLE